MSDTRQLDSNLTYTTHDYSGKETIERILVIEYHGNMPFTVVTDKYTFDFEWCKRDSLLYFNESGSGTGSKDLNYGLSGFCNPSPPPGKIWAAAGVRLHRWVSKRRPQAAIDDAALLALGYVRLRRPLLLKRFNGEKTRNPFEAGEEHDGHFVCCSICDDHMPDDDHCLHIVCTQDEPVGVGGEEPKREQFFAALDWLKALPREQWDLGEYREDADLACVLERLLQARQFPPRFYPRPCILREAEDDKSWDDMEDGFAWLRTLTPRFRKATAKTLAGIGEWREAEPARIAARRRTAAVEALQACATTNELRQEILAALGIPGSKNRTDLDSVPTERIEDVARCRKEPTP